MHSMTMRFHTDMWATIKTEADRLGIPYAEYIRGALMHYIGYQAGLGARGELEARVDDLDRGLRRIIVHLAAKDERAAGGGLRSG